MKYESISRGFQQPAAAISLSLLFSFLQILLPPNLSAVVVTDGTVGPHQSLPGPNYQVPATLGTTSGANLFHSFSSFS
ncbi:MAG: hypothetical protein WCV64_08905, partial [Desulfurivibrionaceae bacterium]